MAALRGLPLRETLRRVASSAVPRRIRRRLAVITAVSLVLAAGYMLWFRDASFLRVEQVSVTGMSTDDAPRVRAALTAAARSMTTLHVDRERLDRLAAAYPAVARLEVSTDFPNGLRIEVVEHEPAAVAISGDTRVAVASDGSLLRGVPTRALPVIQLRGALPDERLDEREAMLAVRVLGTAPAPLRRRLTGVKSAPGRGIVVRMRKGPDLIFGPPVRLGAKWIAAARVLADPAARGATYIDLRLPERPAAGGLPNEPEEPAPVQPAPQPPPTTEPPAGVQQAPTAPGTAPPAGATPTQPAPQTGVPATPGAVPQVPPQQTQPQAPVNPQP